MAYYLSDLFEPLINFHQACQGDQTFGDIIERVTELQAMLLPESEHEDEIRAEFAECCYRLHFWHDPLDIAYVMQYAVLQDVGRHRKNIASFHPRNFGAGISGLSPEKLTHWGELLAPATIQRADALPLLRALNQQPDAYKYIVYCDPPYLPKSLLGHRSQLYEHDWLGLEEQRELLAILIYARFRFILSMGDGPFTRAWYIYPGHFHCKLVPIVHAGRRRNTGNPTTEEWLIWNY